LFILLIIGRFFSKGLKAFSDKIQNLQLLIFHPYRLSALSGSGRQQKRSSPAQLSPPDCESWVSNIQSHLQKTGITFSARLWNSLWRFISGDTYLQKEVYEIN